MRNLAKIIVAVAMIAAVTGAGARNVHAEGLVVSPDKESCEIGDTVSFTVDAEGVGDGTIPPDIQVEFNANRLSFVNCSVEYGGGGGGLVTFKDKKAVLEFTTLSGGAADVTVTATAEDAGEPETIAATVSVNGEDTAAALDAQTLSTGVGEGTIDAGEGRFIQTAFSDEFLPALFHKETCEYNGQTAECAKFDMGDVTLVYTTDMTGQDAKFMIYNINSAELTDILMIQGIENRFIIVLPDCEGPIPSGYTKAVLEWNDQTLTAFMEESIADGTSTPVNGIDPADFFLVYAMSSEGNKGWYRYDKNEGTYQRFITEDGADGEGDSEGAGDDTSGGSILDEYVPENVRTIIALVCAPLALILLIIVIVLAVKVRDLNDDIDEIYDYYEGEGRGYEDEEDEDDEDVRPAVHPAKPGAVTAASLVGRSMAEEDEEAEDEDEDEDEDAGEEDAQEPEEDDRDEDEEDEEDDRDEDDEDEDDEDEDEEDDVKYYKPLTRKEKRELAREEKWRAKEEKKAAKRRAKGYEEATYMDWSSFEKERSDEDVEPMKKSKPPKYMTENMEPIPEEDASPKEKSAPLPPRKKVVRPEESEEAPRVLHEEDQRERQRRLFEQQQRIEEQRRIEDERQEAERLKDQQQFIASRTEDMDLDEDFQFEFLNL